MLKPKFCEVCTAEFVPSGPAARFCSEHAEQRRKEAGRRNTQTYRIRNGLIEKPGVGKGGNQAKLNEDSQFKTGIAFFQTEARKEVRTRRYCERCNKDLLNASRYQWVAHHRDHNRANNVLPNLELLCKRCHQLEHECHKHLKGVTTIPAGSRTQESSKHVEPSPGCDIVCTFEKSKEI